jgi:hypothetical protein
VSSLPDKYAFLSDKNEEKIEIPRPVEEKKEVEPITKKVSLKKPLPASHQNQSAEPLEKN